MSAPAAVTTSPALRVGVVGTGLIAGVVTAALAASQGCRPVAVSSRQRSRALAFAAQHGLAAAYDDWRALLAAADVDAVYIATPTAPRETIAVQAARAGKHVLAEKPFASLASLQAITQACARHGVAFLDGTHFVHHPRTALLKASLAERIGRVQALRCSFFFPTGDRTNLRYDPAQEPTGAVGDMGWYAMRAITEFLDTPGQPAALRHSHGVLQRDVVQGADTGAAIRAAGLMHFEGGATATWDVGYNADVVLQGLQLLGERGVITLDDFVLDWAQGYMLPRPGFVAGFHQQQGLARSDQAQWVAVPSALPANVLMAEHFAQLAQAPQGAQAQAAVAASLRTQALLDAAWASLVPA
jgi:predicted dehydrogenase